MLNWLLGLFPAAKVPEYLRTTLEKEGIGLLEEEIRVTVTYRGYRAPGKYFGWRRKWCRGSLVLTSPRLVVFAWSQQLINVLFDHPAMGSLNFALERPDCLSIRFESSHFQKDSSGKIQCQVRTPSAPQIVKLLQDRTTHLH